MTAEIPPTETWECGRCLAVYHNARGIETPTGCIACRPTERPLNPIEEPE